MPRGSPPSVMEKSGRRSPTPMKRTAPRIGGTNSSRARNGESIPGSSSLRRGRAPFLYARSMSCKLRAFLTFLIFPVFWALFGCPTQSDRETLQRDTNNMTKELLAMQRNFYDLNTEIKNLSAKLDGSGKKSDDLQQQMAALNAETRTKIGFFEKELETSSQPMRRYQADLGARLDPLQMDVQNPTGRFEE